MRMKIWLDDARTPLPEYDVWLQNAETAIRVLRLGGITGISLDHDLGDGLTGYDVAKFIEEGAFSGAIPKMEVRVHSANPVGRANILRCIANAEQFWHNNR
jgi:hypothetical protein